MNVMTGQDFAQCCAMAADIILEQMRRKPDCRLGLATGSTAEGVYSYLVNAYRKGEADFSQVSTCNLDEYAELTPTHEQSYHASMNRWLFDHVNIDKKNTVVACGQGDLDENVLRFREKIERGGPIDLQLLGVGVDGHIAFNEPREKLHLFAHRERLLASTIEANSRFFASRDEVPVEAITMGMGDIMHARRLLLMANGLGKASIMKQLLMDDTVTTMAPVTLLRLHVDFTVLIDRELADAIGYAG